MEKRELISATELPVAETEVVETICIEDGEMKRKVIDLVINVNLPLIVEFGNANNQNVFIESGSLENVVNSLRNGRPPIVKAKHFSIVDSGVPIIEGGIYDCSVFLYNTNITFMFLEPHMGEVKIVMDLEDPDYLEVWAYPVAKTTVPLT